jgi:hypothetical protein
LGRAIADGWWRLTARVALRAEIVHRPGIPGPRAAKL